MDCVLFGLVCKYSAFFNDNYLFLFVMAKYQSFPGIPSVKEVFTLLTWIYSVKNVFSSLWSYGYFI